jgi:hypothetical protein
MANENELKEKLEEINRKLMVMEWDKSHNQLNPGKLGMYNELAEQRIKLEAELLLPNQTDIQTEANSEADKTE